MSVTILVVTAVIILIVLVSRNWNKESITGQSNVVREINEDEVSTILAGSDEECFRAIKEKEAEVIRHPTGYASKRIKAQGLILLNERERRKRLEFKSSERTQERLVHENQKCLTNLKENLDDITKDCSSRKYLKGSRDRLTKIYSELEKNRENPIEFFRLILGDEQMTGFELYDMVIFSRVKNPALLEKSNAVIEEAARKMLELSQAIHEKGVAEDSLAKTLEIKEEFEAFSEFFLP
ncbi:MAG: hypothetical protein IJJ82_02755 [Clostridia bacterium]|nr:hypothetical protein [Clostridia bacterium]